MGNSRSCPGRGTSRLVLVIALLAGLCLWAPAPADAQDDGASIYNQSSGLAVDVTAAGTANGQAIVLWPHNGAAQNQQFRFVAVQGGYKIVARHSGKCLDVSGFSKADGAQVFQWDCHGGANQLWEFVDIGDPKSCPPSGGCPENVVGYLIVSKHSGKCLDSGNSAFPSPPRMGAGLQQWGCARNTGDPWWVNQAWRTGDEPVRLPPLPADAKHLVDQVVQERLGRCADPSVRIDPRLSEVARKHSADLAAHYAQLIDAYARNDSRRGHIGSDGTMPADRVRAADFTPAQRAENWSYGTNQTYAQAMYRWVYDDAASNFGHRDAIRDCTYRVIGVGRADGHNSRVYWTQNFAR
ncbi:RICIN domain-containing protein [Streptomyces tricolor]|uniref:RICIN domain-containing protein n=1 Tax=Streptomyces tricolor TaxID=68277 RepID=A0ABS9JDL7_9ACTN|nr:RICIN domain-containing protein [Streptomyces tricolor]MCG0063644.1 RICIN domain-containing protein [Streptomyces tricolor]